MQIVTGKQKKPARLVIYGVHGIGKSTFAANLPKPIVLQTEDGADEIDVPKVEFEPGRNLAKTFTEVKAALEFLLFDPHDRKTIIIDTIDELERLAGQDVAESEGKDTVADIGFGKGYASMAQRIKEVRDLLDRLRNERHMMICIVGHSEIVQMNPPDMDPYTRYDLKLDKRVRPLIADWADSVLFVNYRVLTKKVDEKFGKDVNKAISTDERIMYTQETAGIFAKNRYGLPPRMEFDAFNTKPLVQGIYSPKPATPAAPEKPTMPPKEEGVKEKVEDGGVIGVVGDDEPPAPKIPPRRSPGRPKGGKKNTIEPDDEG